MQQNNRLEEKLLHRRQRQHPRNVGTNMPTYTFKDNTTGEIYDISLAMRDYDTYLLENPDHERYIDEAPKLVSGTSSSLKTDDGFKEVLSKISEAHPSSPLSDQHLKKSIKQTRTERAVRQWRSKSANA